MAGSRKLTIGELARLVDGSVQPATGRTLEQAAAQVVSGIAALADASADQISHLSSRAYQAALPATRAGAVLLRADDQPECPVTAIVVDNPYWAYARITQCFEVMPSISPGVHSAAHVAASVEIAEGVFVAAGAVVGEGCSLGAGVVIHAGAIVGAGCQLGSGVTLHCGAVLADGVQIGAQSTIHPNAVVGAEGFGYAPDDRGHLERIAQLGSVIVGKNVSVGAGSSIDRGALGDTRIGDGVKIDNQVQIGHNCVIGNHSVICGCCGIVGSTTIGAHCVLGGGVGVGGDGPITLCDGVTVSGMTHVSRSIEQPGLYSGGVLHAESRRWKRNALRFADLDGLAKRVKKLEKRLAPDTK